MRPSLLASVALFLSGTFLGASGAERLSRTPTQTSVPVSVESRPLPAPGLRFASFPVKHLDPGVSPLEHGRRFDLFLVVDTTGDDTLRNVPLLHDLVIEAVGLIYSVPPGEPPRQCLQAHSWVTAMMLPEETEVVALATAKGPLVVRRSEAERLERRRRGSALQTLITGECTPALGSRRQRMITVIKGGAAPTPTAAPTRNLPDPCALRTEPHRTSLQRAQRILERTWPHRRIREAPPFWQPG